MPPSLLRWTFHSPARLVAVSLVVAVMVVAVVVLATPGGGHAPAMTSKAHRLQHVPTDAAPSPYPTPSEPLPLDERQRATRTVRQFADAWARHRRSESRRQWLRDLKPLTTASLHEGLQATDLTRVPSGRVTDLALVRIGSFAGVATVTLNSGLELEVHLVIEHGGWVASDIRPADT